MNGRDRVTCNMERLHYEMSRLDDAFAFQYLTTEAEADKWADMLEVMTLVPR